MSNKAVRRSQVTVTFLSPRWRPFPQIVSGEFIVSVLQRGNSQRDIAYQPERTYHPTRYLLYRCLRNRGKEDITTRRNWIPARFDKLPQSLLITVIAYSARFTRELESAGRVTYEHSHGIQRREDDSAFEIRLSRGTRIASRRGACESKGTRIILLNLAYIYFIASLAREFVTSYKHRHFDFYYYLSRYTGALCRAIILLGMQLFRSLLAVLPISPAKRAAHVETHLHSNLLAAHSDQLASRYVPHSYVLR